MIKEQLFQIAKAPAMGKMVGIAFRYFSWAIPVKKLGNHKDVIAFRHPKPSYENHVILSPRRAIRDLLTLAQEPCTRYFVALWNAVTGIRETQSAYRNAYTLVANGGKRQEVQQVHFHLFTDHRMVKETPSQATNGPVIDQDDQICILKHPQPDWEIHYVIRPVAPFEETGACKDKPAYLAGVLRCIDVLDAKASIVEKGYSLVYQYRRQDKEVCPVFHVVAGKKLG